MFWFCGSNPVLSSVSQRHHEKKRKKSLEVLDSLHVSVLIFASIVMYNRASLCSFSNTFIMP